MRRVLLALFGGLFLAAGCSKGPTVVPVSGTVYLNGKPQGGLWVTFQPMATAGNENPGRGSTGMTDDNGKYTLTYDGTKPGAIVGKHRVAISTVLEGEGGKPGQFDPETGSPDGVPLPKGKTEMIPVEYNDRTKLTFDVPAGGTDKADFKIETKGKR